eukprot:2881990-Amphidinium_carterae.1
MAPGRSTFRTDMSAHATQNYKSWSKYGSKNTPNAHRTHWNKNVTYLVQKPMSNIKKMSGRDKEW